MEQQKKKKKVGVIFAICSAALVLVLGAAVYLPLVFANGNANPPHLFEKKYVSEYDLDYGETAYKVYKNWNVSKYDGRSGTQNLYVWYSGKKSTAREHLSFRVFNSSSSSAHLARVVATQRQLQSSAGSPNSPGYMAFFPPISKYSSVSLI